MEQVTPLQGLLLEKSGEQGRMLPALLSLPVVTQELAVALGMLLYGLEPSFSFVGPGVQQGQGKLGS